MRGAMLFVAGLFTGLAVHVAIAQNANRGVVMMNHVGINVPNIEEAVTYYTQKMGYREAFRVNDDKGQPRLVYMQISKNTFLELNPANAQRPAGLHALRASRRERGRRGRHVQEERRDGERHQHQRHESDPRQHHRPVHGPHRAGGAHAGVAALTRRFRAGNESRRQRHRRSRSASRCSRSASQTQQRGGTAQTDKVQPVNSGANPYRVIRDWARARSRRHGRGAARTAWRSTAMAGPCGRPIGAHRGRLRAVSAPRQTRSIISMSQARRSGALAAGCSCGRTASTSIETAMCG